MRELQQKIINELGVKSTINPVEEIEQRTLFLADYLAQTGLRGYTLGISGGQDSLLAGLLAQRAVDLRKQTGDTEIAFHALLLPHGKQTDRADALGACEVIQPDFVHDLDIKPAVDEFATSFDQTTGTPLTDFDKGNVKARMRMIAQYALAGDQNLLVIGTDHAAEAVTGFFTKYGDGGADILPLSGLTKRQGKQLLRKLGAPEHFMTKAPTADLLDTTPAQADETELGINYKEIDSYLEGGEIAAAAAEIIEQRYLATQHKRTVPIAYDAILLEK